MVSSMLESAGLTHAIIKVWLLPPKESNNTKQNRAQAKWKTFTDLVWQWTEATTINTKTFLLIQKWEKQNGLLNLSYYLWQSSKVRIVPKPEEMSSKYIFNICIKAYLAAGAWAWSLCKEQKCFSCFHPPRHWSHYPMTKGHDWCWCLRRKQMPSEKKKSAIKHFLMQSTQRSDVVCFISQGESHNWGADNFKPSKFLRKSTLSLPSFKRSPSALVFFCLSEPARSTRWNFETMESTLKWKHLTFERLFIL